MPISKTVITGEHVICGLFNSSIIGDLDWPSAVLYPYLCSLSSPCYAC